MASMTDARCTCPESWQGTGTRPLCRQHERGLARRRDGTLVNVLRSAGVHVQEREAGTWSADLSAPVGIVNYGR